jgi:hypothetical protein
MIAPTDQLTQTSLAPKFISSLPHHDNSSSVAAVTRIVFFGNFGPPSLTFARSCRSMGIATYLLAPHAEKAAGAMKRSCYAGFRELSPDAIGTSLGIQEVLQYISETDADAITAISDAHTIWLASYADRFTGLCKLMIPSLQCLEFVESKMRQIEVAKEVGFEVLPTYLLTCTSDMGRIEKQHFPVCLRPSILDSVSPTFKAKGIADQIELAGFLGGIRHFGEGIIAQPFLPFPNGLLHCTSGEDGQLLDCNAFLVDRKFEGLTLRVRPMSAPQELMTKVAALSLALHLAGPYHFEFLLSPEGEWYFLDLNVRFGGTTEKVFRLGVDEPANCLAAYGMSAPRPPRKPQVSRRPVVNKRALLKHIWRLSRSAPDTLDYPPGSRLSGTLRSLRDLILARDSIADWTDIRGTMAFHLHGLIR